MALKVIFRYPPEPCNDTHIILHLYIIIYRTTQSFELPSAITLLPWSCTNAFADTAQQQPFMTVRGRCQWVCTSAFAMPHDEPVVHQCRSCIYWWVDIVKHPCTVTLFGCCYNICMCGASCAISDLGSESYASLVPSVLQQWPLPQMTQQPTWTHQRSSSFEQQSSKSRCKLSPCSGKHVRHASNSRDGCECCLTPGKHLWHHLKPRHQ